ncbi:hypothetical protein KC19_7G084000 [Ceratodon purpureus]|uniref:Secreted protein n=1 Tax=Ceratodon purpureus TaxID=3225 RepID=A0A8T0H908_CERPU|nr:hypothetical protein KC19_7G084000 [Ceratodon purpureus]
MRLASLPVWVWSWGLVVFIGEGGAAPTGTDWDRLLMELLLRAGLFVHLHCSSRFFYPGGGL